MVKSYRVGKSYSMLQETELRLTISKEFIEAQGGALWVKEMFFRLNCHFCPAEFFPFSLDLYFGKRADHNRHFFYLYVSGLEAIHLFGG